MERECFKCAVTTWLRRLTSNDTADSRNEMESEITIAPCFIICKYFTELVLGGSYNCGTSATRRCSCVPLHSARSFRIVPGGVDPAPSYQCYHCCEEFMPYYLSSCDVLCHFDMVISSFRLFSGNCCYLYAV